MIKRNEKEYPVTDVSDVLTEMFIKDFDKIARLSCQFTRKQDKIIQELTKMRETNQRLGNGLTVNLINFIV